VREYDVPAVIVFHNRLTNELELAGTPEDHARLRTQLRGLMDRCPGVESVFISRSKQEDWGLPGDVIPPGIDLGDYGGYHGSDGRVLRVGNFIKRRDRMFGYQIQQQVLRGLPSTLLGLNEGERDARFTASWDDLKECFRAYRLILHTTREAYEDGYNLALLEAMASGMPVVALANATSPVTDGVNGFVSDQPQVLRRRVIELLGNPALARRLGEEARRSVGALFPLAAFVERWNAVLERCAARRVVAPVGTSMGQQPRTQ
jgi:glycosyltransferase involved in cell wall biosynthesis